MKRVPAPATELFPNLDQQPALVENYEDDKPQDECGVLAVYAPGEPVGQMVRDGLRRLQHRGQSGAGVAYNSDEGRIWVHRENGLIKDLKDILPRYDGDPVSIDLPDVTVALGHVRYSTADSDKAPQPRIGKGFALIHNGHLQSVAELAMNRYGVDVSSSLGSDTDALTKVIDKRAQELGGLEAAIADVAPHLEGGYCLALTDGQKIIGVRDPWGTHPLSLAKLAGNKGYMLASETVAFKFVEVEAVRDVEEGEVVVIDKEGVRSSYIDRHEEPAHCMFEYIYFARPNSIVNGVKVKAARKNMGRYLAIHQPVDADVVVGVPSSGLAAADGFSRQSGIPRAEGLIKNDYEARSFIEREGKREDVLRHKFDVDEDEILGKRVVLVDDSLIKGSTMRGIVGMLREAGASEVHVRLAAPPYMHPCYGGMDTRQTHRLIARHQSDEEIARTIGADSVGFSEVEHIAEAINEAQINPLTIRQAGSLLCAACVTGEYPYEVPEAEDEIDLVKLARQPLVQTATS